MPLEHFNLADRLHSDVLSEKYGRITPRVLRHDERVREAHLVDGKGVSRTYALTFFPREGHKGVLARVNARIRRGGLIGEEFKNEGYAVRKNVVHVFTLELPPWLRKAFRTRAKQAKARISEFFAKKEGGVPAIYGTVVEVYHPGFRKALVNNIDLKQINPVFSAFEKNGIPKEEIWRRLGEGNDWADVAEMRSQAKKDCADEIALVEAKVKSFIGTRKR